MVTSITQVAEDEMEKFLQEVGIRVKEARMRKHLS